ncbi:hypothetical protein HU200_066515 [Digitaria exilis]|uniref:Uncharacterized protein n=1 Tax=Digitaria exilis TaxID=1010633 RepID=A0A835A0Y2_9POAL|nr:hypothetical protein HU200_066515 [Digitaria exilis]
MRDTASPSLSGIGEKSDWQPRGDGDERGGSFSRHLSGQPMRPSATATRRPAGGDVTGMVIVSPAFVPHNNNLGRKESEMARGRRSESRAGSPRAVSDKARRVGGSRAGRLVGWTPLGSLIKAPPTLSLLSFTFGRPAARLSSCGLCVGISTPLLLSSPHSPVRWWWWPNTEIRLPPPRPSDTTAGHGLPGRRRRTVPVRALLLLLALDLILATDARVPRRRRMRGAREIPVAGQLGSWCDGEADAPGADARAWMGWGGGGDAEFLKKIEELAAAAGRSASSVGVPLSLRMLKRKKQQQQSPRWDEGLSLGSAGESVGRAFSSMVLIVRELQSFALRQMRDALLCDDVLARVQGEMHASFVWLFQHIFAGTPTLMVSLMLLLANFTVHSMGHSVAAAAAAFPLAPPTAVAAVIDTTHRAEPRFDAASVKTFSVGRTASVGGNSGGGGKAPPVAGATGDGRSDESLYRLSRVAPQQPSTPAGAAAPDAVDADEQAIWEMMVTEASRMQASARAEELSDPSVLGSLVAPVEAELETEDHAEHVRTQQRYEQAVADDPGNSLILANFAQFLYLVQNEHDRAVRAEPADAEALSRYATFLWKARDDLAGAEDAYQEAIAAEPGTPTTPPPTPTSSGTAETPRPRHHTHGRTGAVEWS